MAPDIPDGVDPAGNAALREGDSGSPLRPEAHVASGSASELELNRQLEEDPQSLLLNIRKADYRARAGDDDLACYFYRRALRIAGDRQLPPEEAAEVRRSERALAEAAGRAHSRREARLRERGLPPQQRSPRLKASLDLAARPRPWDVADPRDGFAQDPTHYHYPGLPRIPFYDRDRFDWAARIEAATAAVREELIGLLASGKDEPRPFRPSDVGLPLGVGKALVDGRNWGVLALCEQGWLDPDYIRRCPRTWDTLLHHAPVPRVPGWGPSIIFSMLSAGAHIGAHTGMYNSRLICHLPLIVPPGCRFRVGNEVREWEEGKLLIFDDTIEHEAWNDGPEDRVVLIFDIWRPELTEQEKFELTLLFSD
ncbi:MAG TPA: aspartyl/asparaginyl beta-hydroxylase domain-containing protein [Allosphingosinicella sp.]|jgi:aspartyl/asparaginyl beta-hydroxylase (cupin superfamily)